MTRSLSDSLIEMEFLVSDESPYFSHYACEILHATDVISENVAKVRLPQSSQRLSLWTDLM